MNYRNCVENRTDHYKEFYLLRSRTGWVILGSSFNASTFGWVLSSPHLPAISHQEAENLRTGWGSDSLPNSTFHFSGKLAPAYVFEFLGSQYSHNCFPSSIQNPRPSAHLLIWRTNWINLKDFLVYSSPHLRPAHSHMLKSVLPDTKLPGCSLPCQLSLIWNPICQLTHSLTTFLPWTTSKTISMNTIAQSLPTPTNIVFPCFPVWYQSPVCAVHPCFPHTIH